MLQKQPKVPAPLYMDRKTNQSRSFHDHLCDQQNNNEKKKWNLVTESRRWNGGSDVDYNVIKRTDKAVYHKNSCIPIPTDTMQNGRSSP